jgi:DNA replication protein DnaC
MLNEETFQKLAAMKLHGLATGFHELLDQKGPDKLTFEEWFGLMVDREWTGRQGRKLKARLQLAKLRFAACMEDIDYRHPRGLDRSVMQRLGSMRWVAEKENVIITGLTGTGKTWIASALGDKACREDLYVRYFRLPRLLESLRTARGDGTYEKTLSLIAKTTLIIIDDFGLATFQDGARRDLLEIVEDRYGRASTIVASQVPVKEWHAAIGDPTVADAILDRLTHNAHRINLKGPSIRNPGGKNGSKE